MIEEDEQRRKEEGILVWGVGVNDILSRLNFYPTALKGSPGIVFTSGVLMGEQAFVRQEKVWLGCISETIRCRKLILNRDIG